MTGRTCSSCDRAKPASEFYRHSGYRNGLRSDCKECLSAKQKNYRAVNRARISERDRRYHQGVAPRRRARRLAEIYRITPQDVDRLFTAQAGKCAVCQNAFGSSKSDRPNVDHDHLTGVVRGLLCARCNFGVGRFRDDPELLRAAAAYIELSKQLRQIA